MANRELETLLKLVEGNNQIIIPIIQRDYAQGRSDVEELKNNFVEYLKNKLLDNHKVELDFVYGTLSDNRYTILDGQQRLTTLFLLHWYLAKLDERDECYESFRDSFKNDNKINFSYETRASSEEFCKAIITNDFSLKDIRYDKENPLSKTISNKYWFITSWRTDPTVNAMLNMIDTIHEKFHDTKDLYHKLEQGVIGFKFLELEKFQLTDDLYIKMNSTGLPLTQFENFKAHLEKHIKLIQKDTTRYLDTIQKEISLQEYFSFRMDSIWSDFFWKYSNNKDVKVSFDDMIMNLFHSIFTNKFYEDNKDWDDDFIIQRQDKFIPLSCKKYIERDLLNTEIVEQISIFLDIISMETWEPLECFYYSEQKNFIKITSGSPSYQDRLLFYAYFIFIISHTNCQNNSINFDKYQELYDWMRVIYNLVENTIYDDVGDYSRDLKVIKDLLPNSDNIMEYISKNSYSGFSGYQKEEEKLKALLIVADNTWYDILQNIEKHNYLKGQIRFLLDISEITADITEHKNYQHKLQTNFEIFNFIFDNNGLRKFDGCLWERALLSKGDYLVRVGANHTFCTNSDRDTSWKNCFQDKSDILRMLFEDIQKRNINPDNINTILLDIIDNRNKENSNSWREQFIQYPALMINTTLLGQKYRYIRKVSPQGFCLLTGKRMSSKHTELFSTTFFLEYKEQIKFINFEWIWCQYSITEQEIDQPFARLDIKDTGYFLGVYFYKNHYSIWLGHEEDTEHPIEQYYIDKVTTLEFEEAEPHWYKLENLETAEAVIEKLKELDKIL